ncbi:hypothetical protein BGZ68_002893 [Mortierella alpina]|nr:hypothetical protein BGZ68_002893 [Mortierella alpina]
MKVITSSLIALISVLAIAVTSSEAQFPIVNKKKCDEKYSLDIGNCVKAHPKDPGHPERKQCTISAHDGWRYCLNPCC